MLKAHDTTKMYRYHVWYQTFEGPQCATVEAINPTAAKIILRRALDEMNTAVSIGDVQEVTPDE